METRPGSCSAECGQVVVVQHRNRAFKQHVCRLVCIPKEKTPLDSMEKETWYSNMEQMAADDSYLQATFIDLKKDLSKEALHKVADVHVYPSLRCTYTIAKKRIFIKVRDDNGAPLPACVIRYVLLHELAHTINPTEGHDNSFRHWLGWISEGISTCGNAVPNNYNPCH